MLSLLVARHRAHAPLFAALVVASAVCSALVAARVSHTGRMTYSFLVYNLALAWIPVAFAAAAYALGGVRSRASAVAGGLCSAGWLLFFQHAAVGAFCAVLAGVMFVAYLVFYAWTSVRARA